MAQTKVVNVGYRRYQVLTTNSFTDNEGIFDRIDLAERVLIRNLGAEDIKLRLNHPLADVITIPGNQELNLPVKVKKVILDSGTAGNLEIIGYSE